MLDAEHDPFVGREETPLGVARRGLYDLLAQLEGLRLAAPTRIDVLAGEAAVGSLDVGPEGLTLPDSMDATLAPSHLARALHTWASTHSQPLRVAPNATPVTAAIEVHSTITEAFARAGALSENPREDDAASRLYRQHESGGRPAVLVRLRERSELLPYPVAAQALGNLRLRGLVGLCHAAARLVRPPGWQSTSRPTPSWGILRLPEWTCAVVPGDTHIALLGGSQAELDELFLRISSPSAPGPGARDAR